MALRRRADEVPAGLAPVLLPGETLIIAVRQHWAWLLEPIASTVAAFAVALFVDSKVTASTQFVGTVVWWAFFAVALRLIWLFLQWRHDWFVATDKRLVMRYGMITHKVAMMPLAKVTDMSYERTIPGQLLGFGRFVMESAGQDQALHVINWVPNPDVTYRAICAEIFHIVPPGRSQNRDPADQPYPEADPVETPEGPRGPGGRGDSRSVPYNPSPISNGPDSPESIRHDVGYPDVPRIHDPIQDRHDSYSRAVPIQSPEAPDQGESIYQSDDLRKRRRAADTGPLPLWPPAD